MENIKYSITSNVPKLLKHLDNLKSFQNKKSMPIMVHLMVTNQCNLNCPTCCFSAIRNDGRFLELDYVKEVMKQFRELGTKSVEITGGGDLTCYNGINELIVYLHELGFSIGTNTNGILAQRIKHWDKFKWVRLSMNTLDFYPETAYPLEYIRSFKPTPSITGCYVWNNKGNNNLDKVITFANKEKISVRVVPNCITEKDEIKRQMKEISEQLETYKENEFVFVSDHNVDLGIRENNNCYIHHIKPTLFTDGWVYACPSSELSLENGITLQEKFRICKGTDVLNYYMNNFEIKHFDCSYCKYKQQNQLLEMLLMETSDNDFA